MSRFVLGVSAVKQGTLFQKERNKEKRIREERGRVEAERERGREKGSW